MAVVSPNQPIHPTLDERISVKVEGALKEVETLAQMHDKLKDKLGDIQEF